MLNKPRASLIDHSKAVKDLLKAGVDCWMSSGTAKALGVEYHHRTHTAASYMFGVEGRKIFPFPLEHDAAEPIGFFIEDIHGDKCLFIPDTAFIKNRFLGVNILCVECNFVPDILSRNIAAGLPQIVGSRIRRNHMSLDTVIAMIQANDLSRCREIWLLHLSDGNSDENEMRSRVQEATGIPTFVAQADSHHNNKED